MPLYLDLDSSTQSLTVMLLDVGHSYGSLPRVVFEYSIVFDADLNHYGTENGVLPSGDPRVTVSPPVMWAEALESRRTLSRKFPRMVLPTSGCPGPGGSVIACV